MAALNTVDAAGVHERVIDEVNEWRVWLDNEDNPRRCPRHEFSFSPMTDVVNERDAEYIVECLQAFLPLEQSLGNNNPRRTDFVLELSEEHYIADFDDSAWNDAITVVCDYLQQPNTHLMAITLTDLSPITLHRLLQSLHTNKCLEELTIDGLNHRRLGRWLGNLLSHKTNLTVLDFYFCEFPISDILPGLRGMTHLRKLHMACDEIGDAETRLILQALGDRPRLYALLLEDLILSANHITDIGLRSLAELIPLALPHLKKLSISSNDGLLDDEPITQFFVERILLSDAMALEELHIDNGGQHTTFIIKACENDNCKLRVLDISLTVMADVDRQQRVQCYRSQLVESLPKIKGLQELICDPAIFNHDDAIRSFVFAAGKLCLVCPDIMAALHQNTSLAKISMSHGDSQHPVVTFILKRNQMLKHADSLLLATRTGKPMIRPKSGLWCKAFAKMTAPTSITTGGAMIGASAIFKILQNQFQW